MGKKRSQYEPQAWETVKGKGHWTRLYDDLLDSPAFMTLTPEAKILYFYMKRQYDGPYNKEKDTIIFPYNHAVNNIGIRKGNIRSCINELEQFGFIKTTRGGGLYREPSRYTFIMGWKNIDGDQAAAIKSAIKQERAEANKTKPKKTAFVKL